MARQLESIKIVSFDWLEDSLFKMYPRKEREYLMRYGLLPQYSTSSFQKITSHGAKRVVQHPRLLVHQRPVSPVNKGKTDDKC